MSHHPGKASADFLPEQGWTLIEVLVVMVIAALLATLAYPSYQQVIIRARRAEAKAALLQLMQQEERFHTQRNRYVAFSADAVDEEAKRFRWHLGEKPAESAYQIEGIACPGESTDDCILLQAMPGGPQVNRAFKDAQCGRLSLSSTGAKMADGDVARCW